MLLEQAVHAIINNKRRTKMEGTAEKDDAHYRGSGVRCHQDLEVFSSLASVQALVLAQVHHRAQCQLLLRVRPFVVYLSEFGSIQSLSQSTHWRIQL